MPVTTTWSNAPAPVPPISSLKTDPTARVRAPVDNTPGEFPAQSVPPVATFTAPATVPEPPSVAPFATATARGEFSAPFTSNVPALTEVAPV